MKKISSSVMITTIDFINELKRRTHSDSIQMLKVNSPENGEHSRYLFSFKAKNNGVDVGEFNVYESLWFLKPLYTFTAMFGEHEIGVSLNSN